MARRRRGCHSQRFCIPRATPENPEDPETLHGFSPQTPREAAGAAAMTKENTPADVRGLKSDRMLLKPAKVWQQLRAWGLIKRS